MSNTHGSSPLKRCVRCERILPLDQFNRSAGSSDGLHSYCRRCQSEYQKAHQLPAVPLPARTCDFCGEEFVPSQRSQRFCSKLHKQRAIYWKKNPREKRVCQECGNDLSESRRDKKFCDAACANRNRNRERPEIKRRHVLKKQYGLTLEAYDALLESQAGVCAICGTNEVRGFGKHMAIDHCHDHGHVRGILCGNCNRGLGSFRHDQELLTAAARYLAKE